MVRGTGWLPVAAISIGVCGCGGSDSDESNGATPNVVFVDARAALGGDGRSWSSALRFVSDALRIATDGATIRVATGTYRPDHSEERPDGTGDRSASFQLRSGIELIGGYAGIGADNPDARDAVANVTTLSGDLADNDGDLFANRDDNSFHVVTGSRTDATAVLDGFTISGGNADGMAAYPEPDGMGGGLLDWYDGNPKIVRCSFVSNSARYAGGAIANGFASSPTISESSFRANRTVVLALDAAGGGAIANLDSSSPVITTSTFNDNQAIAGGAMLNEAGASPSVTGCSFEDNRASLSNGGAIFSRKQSLPYVRDCVFRRNDAGHVGGALGFRETPSDVWIIDSLFEQNHANDSGGAVRVGNSASVHVVNCSFHANSTGSGSAAVAAPAGGLDVGSDGDVALRTSTIENSIFWGNTAGNEQRQLAASGNYAAGLVVDYSDVAGGSSGVFVTPGFPFTWGEGNHDADPLFVDAAAGDLHLDAVSPCLGVGNPGALPSEIRNDLDGNPRFGAGGLVDLGSYQRSD